MARIPQEEVDRIKHEVRIEELVRAYGVELRPHGAKDLIGKCPFHDDTHASLVVTPEKNLWHCLGACQTGGDVFAWLQKIEAVSFRHAYELLSTRFFVASPVDGLVMKKRSDVPKLGAPFTLEMDDDELRQAYIDYCHEELKRSPEASRYLEKRGLVSSELVSTFRLGFSNRTLGLRLPAMSRKEGQAIRSRLQNIGILRSSGHEHFNGCLMIPIFDEEGRVSEIYGRKITQRLTPGLAHHLYLPGPHHGVWNAEVLHESKEIILCEALIDAMTFWCAGYRNVTSSYGVEGFSPDHLEAFRRHGTEHVLIAYDRDEAGDRAAEKLAEKLLAAGIRCSRIKFPHSMDANEYALKVTPAEKSLGVVIRSAEWIGNGAKVIASTPEPALETEADRKHATIAAPSLSIEVEPETPLQPHEIAPAHSLAADPVELRADVTPTPELPVQITNEEVTITFGDRRYRIRGLKKNTSYDSLKINVMVSREGLDERVFMDTFDLAIARQRTTFEKAAAAEVGVREEVVHNDVGQLLKTLEILREKEIEKALAPKVQPVVLTTEEHAEAMHLLQSPDLLQKIIDAFDRCGLVGERTNKLVAYLAAVSRKLDYPLAIIIQSSSAAGKTALMDAVLALMPKDERVRYSAMTGKALFYITETSLKHKILAISEEEGAEQASYALKLLQSEGELTIASTGKDPQTGKLVTQEYHVEGPVMIILTTTKIDIDEELLNRCIVLTVDEDREQTRAIHRLQREAQTLEGLLGKKEAGRIRRTHQNAQRLLRPVHVVNPYARELTFLDGRTRTRRDHTKYLTLIKSIALLHQYQRLRKSVGEGTERVEYIEVTLADIAMANELAHEVLGRSLDELPPQTRRLLQLIDEMVSAECSRQRMTRADYHFSRKAIRDFSGWGETQVRVHLDRLVSLEYVLMHRGGRGQSFVYELMYERKNGADKPVLFGLVDVAALARGESTTPTSRGVDAGSRGDTPGFAGSSRAESGPFAATSRDARIVANASTEAAPGESNLGTSLDALLRDERKKTRTYVLQRRSEGNGKDRSKAFVAGGESLRILRAMQRRRS
ncbi:MAG TPA: DNA primase [Gemmatimonadaceae bacterium]|nr:DNA primase [Gemmatimonadaceae bacterium]